MSFNNACESFPDFKAVHNRKEQHTVIYIHLFSLVLITHLEEYYHSLVQTARDKFKYILLHKNVVKINNLKR